MLWFTARHHLVLFGRKSRRLAVLEPLWTPGGHIYSLVKKSPSRHIGSEEMERYPPPPGTPGGHVYSLRSECSSSPSRTPSGHI